MTTKLVFKSCVLMLMALVCMSHSEAGGPAAQKADQSTARQGGEPMKLAQSRTTEMAFIPETVIAKTQHALIQKFPNLPSPRLEKGVRQTAALWRQEDGTPETFEKFCLDNFFATEQAREAAFLRISKNLESLWGHLDMIRLDFQWAQQIDEGEVFPVDYIFGGYDPGAHWQADFFLNKLAFAVILNFPFLSLEEKTKAAPEWSSKEWAFARLGDEFTSRTPPALLQNYARVNSEADVYISGYNIMAGRLLNEAGEKLFPAELKLLSHWNLRDQIKSDYLGERGLEKQQLIYEVMKRIVSQEIPGAVINNGDLEWKPVSNKVYRDGKEAVFHREPDNRYRQLLAQFRAQREMDVFYPEAMNTYIKRQFDGEMEISQPEVEALFIRLLSSPQAKKTAELIRSRLKRDLKPYDIWYNGFSSRSGISEEKLNAITRKRYPGAKALERDIEPVLLKLGFPQDQAAFLASRIEVDPARGSGHARGAQMKSDKARLRTRVFAGGMDYKGYNIAIHELGHNTEQTISLHDVDYYLLAGVPNTAFTEALAFIFQERDLELLGLKEPNPDKNHLLALDTFWNVYEIMGVSLVDMRVWKWLYENPDADETALKQAVTAIAIDVWNGYYAGVFGMKDEPVLAVYSHMISYPLYLSNYSYGHVIHFQLEEYLRGKDLAREVRRMFKAGRLTPGEWMKNAVGADIAIEPLLTAVDKALEKINQ